MNALAIFVVVFILPNFLLLLWHILSNIFILFLHRQFPEIVFTYACGKQTSDARARIPVKKMIALTIDDAPYNGRSNVNRILDILKRFECHATFFVIGSYLRENDEVLKRMVDENNEIGNHGFTNSRAVSLSDPDLISEIDKTGALYAEHAQEKIYRPGCGYFSQAIIGVCNALDYKLILGSVYSFDAQIIFPWVHYYHIATTCVSGDIVILHDRWWTIPLLWILLPTLKWRGFEVTTVSKLLREKKKRSIIFEREFAFPFQTLLSGLLLVAFVVAAHFSVVFMTR